MRLSSLFLLLILLLTGCGAPTPAGGPTGTPLRPEEQASATALALAGDVATAAPAATGGPPIVPTPPTTALSEAESLAATQTAFALPTLSPTPLTEAESGGTATAWAVVSMTGTAGAFTPAMSETATAAAAATFGTAPALVTRTPVVGMPRVLPAPLYLRSFALGQVIRVEPDAANYRQLTFERLPVLDLAVPAAGGLFYITGEEEGERALVSLGGAGRRELLSGKLSGLAVTPDGARAFVRVDDPAPGLIIGQDESPAGVWGVSAEGGRPGLVLADVPPDALYDPDAPAWTYTPLAVSPDGRSLAVWAYDQDGPGIPGGELVIVDLAGQREPVRVPTCCEAPVWAADSAALLVAGGGPAPDTRYGLYRADVASGAETPLLAGDDNSVPLATAPYATAAGETFALVELAPAEGFGWEYPFQPAIARVEPDGAVTPLSPPLPMPIEALWADGGRGVLLSVPGPDPARAEPLVWQAAGEPSVSVPFDGADMAWVPANGPLEAGDCALFNPLAYQPGAGRQADPAVADLQGRLLALGFDGGPADGLYGEQTRAGVMAFQQTRGLPASGDVDCATWRALLAQP